MRRFTNALTVVGIVVLFALAASDVFADEYRPLIKWEPPTSFVSGEPLDPLTDLAEYRLYCTPDVGTQVLVQISPPYEWRAPVGLFLPGAYDCYMTAVATTAKGGGESAPSNTKNFVVAVDRPAPIVIFDIE